MLRFTPASLTLLSAPACRHCSVVTGLLFSETISQIGTLIVVPSFRLVKELLLPRELRYSFFKAFAFRKPLPFFRTALAIIRRLPDVSRGSGKLLNNGFLSIYGGMRGPANRLYGGGGYAWQKACTHLGGTFARRARLKL